MNDVIRISEDTETRDKKRFISGVMRLLRHQDEKFYHILVPTYLRNIFIHSFITVL